MTEQLNSNTLHVLISLGESKHINVLRAEAELKARQEALHAAQEAVARQNDFLSQLTGDLKAHLSSSTATVSAASLMRIVVARTEVLLESGLLSLQPLSDDGAVREGSISPAPRTRRTRRTREEIAAETAGAPETSDGGNEAEAVTETEVPVAEVQDAEAPASAPLHAQTAVDDQHAAPAQAEPESDHGTGAALEHGEAPLTDEQAEGVIQSAEISHENAAEQAAEQDAGAGADEAPDASVQPNEPEADAQPANDQAALKTAALPPPPAFGRRIQRIA